MANIVVYLNQDTIKHFNTIDYITIASTGNATDFGDIYSCIYKRLVDSLMLHGGL